MKSLTAPVRSAALQGCARAVKARLKACTSTGAPRRNTGCLLLTACCLLSVASSALAQQRYALIVAGANGGQDYAQQYARWSDELSKLLAARMKIEPSNVTVLTDAQRPETASTAANVRRVLNGVRGKAQREDLLFVFLIGHGTFDGVDAKFNLVGPDIEAAEWAALLSGIPARLVVVNSTSASFPFLERLAGPRRVVITATDSPAQRFDTVFPEYFIKAFQDDAADIDKNGRISIWEAFAAASAGVSRHYQQRGQLATERALLDDTGDGIGKEATDPGDEGSMASRTYLDEAAPGAAPTDETLIKLLQKRKALEGQVEELRIRRTFMPAAEYAKEFERLMIELAQVSHELRERKAKS
jgi:hypothetical protein